MPDNIVSASAPVLPQLPNGLKNIALSFSGGGFRAAGFSLGCFSYLENTSIGEQKLSGMVRFISSASGGSFASMAIVQAQRQGGTFADAYRNLFAALDGDRLLKRVHEILVDDGIWQNERPTKDRNFINAFAIAYDELIFNRGQFDILWKPAPEGSVAEICVNATDFTHGQQFRFQHDGSDKYSGEFGNDYLKFKTEKDKSKKKGVEQVRWQALRKIKLGDILAASSCFPGGFEPIMYPNDFAWRDKNTNTALTPAELLEAIVSDDSFINKKPVKDDGPVQQPAYGLMDGGIVDNQGIDAFQLAEGRLKTSQAKPVRKLLTKEANQEIVAGEELDEAQKLAVKNAYKEQKRLVRGYGYDLFAACDVSSNYTNQYSYPTQDNSNWLLKPSLLLYALLIITLFLAGLLGITTKAYPALGYLMAGAFGWPIALLIIAVAWQLVKKLPNLFFGKKEPAAPNTFKKLFGKHIWYFLNLPLNRVINLLVARGGSLANLAIVLFLKKIRQNAYKNHFDSSLEKKEVQAFIQAAAEKSLLAYSDKTGFDNLLLSQKSWQQNTVNPTVYLLGTKNKHQFLKNLKAEPWDDDLMMVVVKKEPQKLFDLLQPSPQITAVADIGTNMATTLWFDHLHMQQNMRAALIAAGQFTMCHYLLRFAFRFADESTQWQQWQNELLEHWQLFQQNPYWLYNKIATDMASAGKPLNGFETVR